MKLLKKKSQVLNFLWINLDLPPKPDFDDGSIRQPLPEEYIANVRKAAMQHPNAEIDFWFDSKRLTERQWQYLEAVIQDGLPNAHVKDLRSIPAYDQEELYNKPETDPHWRSGYSGVVWLQVDAAKILISLQGNFDQHFFADLDHAHLDIESNKVQTMLKKHGLMIGSSSATYASFENQLWGFDRSRRNFFEKYYKAALKDAYKGENGFYELCRRADELRKWLVLPLPREDICLLIKSEGMAHAEQPGHEWSGQYNYWGDNTKDRQKPAVISAQRLTEIFSAVLDRREAPQTVKIVTTAKAPASHSAVR